MGTNRLLREKWDFSRLGGRPEAAPAVTRATTSGPHRDLPPSDLRSVNGLFLVVIAAVALALANPEAPLATLATGGANGPFALFNWIKDNPWILHAGNLLLFVALRLCLMSLASWWRWTALGISIVLGLVALTMGTQLNGTLWLFAGIPASVLLVYALLPQQGARFNWRIQGIVFAGLVALGAAALQCVESAWWLVAGPVAFGALSYSLIDALIDKYPQTERSRGAAGWITLISMTALLALGALQIFAPQNTPDRLASSVSGLETVLQAMQRIAGSLAAFPATLAATALVASLSALIRCERLDDEEKEERRRLLGRIPLHHNLRTVNSRLILLGTAKHEIVTQACASGLIEIWLRKDNAYRFDASEMIALIETHLPNFASGDGHYDLIVTQGEQRQVVAYETVSRFYELLADPNEKPLIGAFERQKISVIQERLQSITISSSEKKLSALRSMASNEIDRILVVGAKSKYLGFCERDQLVQEVFGG